MNASATKEQFYYDFAHEKYVRHIHSGQHVVTSRNDLIFMTVLGSCVAVCLYDTIHGVGGMNHYLLPRHYPGSAASPDQFAPTSMQKLLDEMLQAGADRRSIKASVFGGSRNKIDSFAIGDQNAEYAIDFLKRNQIEIVNIDTGGKQGRTIKFFPTTGRILNAKLRPDADALVERPRPGRREG